MSILIAILFVTGAIVLINTSSEENAISEFCKLECRNR